MARKEINIGSTGNDATGDSIRTGFDKVNKNFIEVYAALGLGGGLNFEGLDNTPSSLTSNKLIVTNATGDAIQEKALVGDGITVDFSADPNSVYIRNTGTELARDTSPELGGNLDALGQFKIVRLVDPTNPQDAVTKQYADDTFLDAAGDTATGVIRLEDGSGGARIPTIDAEATNKGYVDTKVAKDGDTMTGSLFLDRDPLGSDAGNIAATKRYVDNSGYSSQANIFVSKQGRTEQEQLDDSVSQENIGRSLSTAFSSVRDALFYAERIIKGDETLKREGLLPSTHINFFPVPGRKPGPYTVNLAADGTEDLTNVIGNSLLTQNRRFIQEEVVAFINRQRANSSSSIWTSFTYNAATCRRDTEYLVDSVRYDLAFNSNYRSVSSALRYLSGTASTVTGSQKAQTLAAFAQAKAYTAAELTDTIAIARSNTLWDEIIDIVDNGAGAAAAYTYPTPTGGSTNASDSGYAFAVQQLVNNKTFMQDEIIYWIAVQVAGNTPPFSSGFTYDSTACRRDVGFILDAVIYDINYGGNLQTYDAMKAYYDAAVAQYGAGEKEEVLAAMQRLKTIVGQCILEQGVTKSTGNPSSQSFASSAGSSAAATRAQGLIQAIYDYIDGDGASLPARTAPDVTWVSASLQSEVIALGSATQSAIATNVTNWIDSQIAAAGAISSTFTYNQETCYRDVGLIIDAMSFDLTYVGNSRTVDAAASYWNGATSRIPGEVDETIAAYNFMKSLIQNYVLTNTAYPVQTGFGYPNASAIIEANKEFIIDEVDAWLQQAIASGAGIWSSFAYDRAKCNRDVGIILDGIAFDLKFGGNTKTRYNAYRYFEGAYSKIAGEEAQTVAALNYARDLVADYIVTNTAFASLQTGPGATKQTTSLTVGETASRARIDTLMDSISTVITNGLGSLPVLEGTHTNQSEFQQVIDANLIAEAGVSTTLGSLITIITDVLDNGLGSLPAKVGGQGRETNIPAPEITVHIESGLYEEYMPITLPDNVSVKGDEFRRVVIQPVVGVRPPQRALDLTFERGDLERYDGTSIPQIARFRNHYDSQYSRADSGGGLNVTGSSTVRLKDLAYKPINGQYFVHSGTTYYIKNMTFDPLSVGDNSVCDAELYSDINTTTTTTLQADIANNTIIELKKLNQHMDVFLCNNATIMRNVSVRRHQGFAMVLDPEGQILTKSPYAQTCSSFSSQGGGGQYVDGNAGVQYGSVVDNPASGFSITLQGLTRKVQLPTTFLYQGTHPSDTDKKTYRIIGATSPVDDGLGNGTFKQTLTLASDTEIAVDTRSLNNGTIPQGTTLRIETAGNKSMTCNDYTQLNNEGFGLVATNAGLIEAVSVFTYYCDISYLARNGGQIRSLNGSSCYGRVGLQAEGSDPNENIQSGTLFFRQLNATATGSPDVDFTQEVTSHNPSTGANLTGDTTLQIRDFDYLPFPDSRTILTAFSTNNDSTEYVVEEITLPSVGVVSMTNANPGVFTTSPNHYMRNGSVIELDGFDDNGTTGVDGFYYMEVISPTTFRIHTNSSLSAAVDTTSVGTYTGSGGTVIGGGRADLTLGQSLFLGSGTEIADGERILITVGKKAYVKGLIDTPRVLPSSAMQFATGNQQVFRILNIERDTFTEPDGDHDLQEQLFDLRVPTDRTANETVKVTTKISTMRATGHDFLNVGWGNYIDSNYPNNVYGAPVGRPDYSVDQASEAIEVGAGRVFYASTDQDGNFRVGRYFRVNQGDGSVELNANIGLTNVDSLGFTKGTTINEFSTDDKFQGQSDDAVPTEASIGTYINSVVVGRHEDGTAVTPFTANGSQATTTTGGLLNRDGYDASTRTWNKMQGELNMNSNLITNISMVGATADDGVNKNYADNVFRGATTDSIRTDVKTFEMLNDSTLNAGAIYMNNNQIKGLMEPTDNNDAVTKSYVDRANTLDGLSDVTISGTPNDTDLLMFTGVNTVDQYVDYTHSVNVALDTSVNGSAGTRIFGEPTGTGSDVRLTRTGNTLNIQLATGSVKNADVSAEAEIAQSKLAMNFATARDSANAGGRAVQGVALNNPLRVTTSSNHDLISGDQITINNISGTTQLNGNSYYVSVISVSSIDLYTDAALSTPVNGTTGFSPYTSGGYIYNDRLLQESSGLASFDSDEFSITSGWVTHKTSTGTSDGLPLTKITHQSGNTMLGVSGASAGAVTALTPAQIRTLIDFDNSVETYITSTILDNNGALLKSGGTMTGTLTTRNQLPSANNTYDIGSASYVYNDTYSTNFIGSKVQGASLYSADGLTLILNNTGVQGTSRFYGSADTLTTTRTFSITGEASGSATFNGSGDCSINVTLSNTALDDQYVDVTGDTMTGTLTTRALTPSANNTYNIGSSGSRYSTIYCTTLNGTATAANYADLAENYVGDDRYEPGTVVMFGGEQEVTIAGGIATRKVAGIVSTNPAHLMNADLNAEHVVAVALQGRVPCKVRGTINKGDMLVVSGTPGVATASDDPKLGSVIGKALENYDSDSVGVIEVVVGRV